MFVSNQVLLDESSDGPREGCDYKGKVGKRGGGSAATLSFLLKLLTRRFSAPLRATRCFSPCSLVRVVAETTLQTLPKSPMPL